MRCGVIRFLPNLMEVNLLNNPVARKQLYRPTAIFHMQSLRLLDSKEATTRSFSSFACCAAAVTAGLGLCALLHRTGFGSVHLFSIRSRRRSATVWRRCSSSNSATLAPPPPVPISSPNTHHYPTAPTTTHTIPPISSASMRQALAHTV